jgi:hypothetical protein
MLSYMELPRRHHASLDQAEDDSRQLRQLARAGGWTRRERLSAGWYRLRLIVQEMNYATRRLTEKQMALPAEAEAGRGDNQTDRRDR